MMKIYPAIDLMKGQCVRLTQGDFTTKKIYADDPLQMVDYFKHIGMQYLHVVDLDGAKAGKIKQSSLIKKMIQQTSLKIQVGGGIRDTKTITTLLNQGVNRVILGSIAVNQPATVSEWLQKFGNDKIVIALDVFADNIADPLLATKGWQQKAKINLWDLLKSYQVDSDKNSTMKSINVLCTDICRDGTLQGPNFLLYEQCLIRFPEFKFIASGGVRDLQDIKNLKNLDMAAVILGKSLYENRLSLEELISC
jgi:phosphoribosylformimino-5-aminoimidazole carboxamide ribotide isomerase